MVRHLLSLPAHLIALVLATVLASTGAFAVDHTADPLDQVKAAVDAGTAVLIDVREQGEWDLGHLKTARLVPLSGLNKDAAAQAAGLPKDKPIYLHCKSGGRCLVAAELLKPLGYDVRPLKAGYGELVRNGFAKAE